MALNGLICADVPLSNYSLAHPKPQAEFYLLETAGLRNFMAVKAGQVFSYILDWNLN